MLVKIFYTNVRGWNNEKLKGCLSQDEISQLNSIRHPLTLNQKIISRALLRRILVEQYGFDPSKLKFEYNSRGKPFLLNDQNIHFNCSHSSDLVMIGISKVGPIGVDVEKINFKKDEDAIAKSFFSPDEYSCYSQYKLFCSNAFYEFWTAKEAIIKAFGKGLWESDQVPLIIWSRDQFSLKSDLNSLVDWSLFFPAVQHGYCASVVAYSALEASVDYIEPKI